MKDKKLPENTALKDNYKLDKNPVYDVSKLISAFGFVFGYSVVGGGLVNGSESWLMAGLLSALPSLGYYFGTVAAEGQFKKFSDLEQKLP